MRLALTTGYGGTAHDTATMLRLVQEAERLGFASVWVAEAYGADAVTVLSWLAAHTERIDLGAGVLQIPARSPAMTAMTAASLDSLSGGRFRLGLGVSGPQVSEGWHGVRFADPLGRTREYVDIVRLALERKRRVKYEGEHFQLPLPDGPGKALRLILHPMRDQIPVYLAALGPRNLHLTGAIADGWLGVFVAARALGDTLGKIEAGRAEAGKTLDGFDVCATATLATGTDVEACADKVRPGTALYIGGMGSRQQNFYLRVAERLGYADAAATVQQRYLSRDYAGAAAALPFELVDETALIGDEARIADRMRAYADAGVTTLSVGALGDTEDEQLAALRTAAAALDRAGVG